MSSLVFRTARTIYGRLLRMPGLPPVLGTNLRKVAANFRTLSETPGSPQLIAVTSDSALTEINAPESTPPTINNPWNSDKPFDISGMWFSAQLCVETIHRAISGDPNIGLVQYIVEQYLKDGPDTQTLVMGSNEGNMTISLRKFGYQGAIAETDIAEKAMQRAAIKHKEADLTNITQIPLNLNQEPIPGQFDFIIAEGVLHHIEQIEFCLNNLLRSLKPGGLLLAVEYIGPVRFQLSELNLRWINAALDAMPRSLLKVDSQTEFEFPPSPTDMPMVHYVVPTEEAIRQFDPSEACIGEILDDLLCSKFQVIERKGFGGTLLSYMTGLFDFERSNHDEFARAWLGCLIQIEQTVIESGILKDQFCFYVLRRKDVANTASITEEFQ